MQDGAFFVSASNDETCRVWDTRKLERDVSFRSRLTFNAQACCWPPEKVKQHLHADAAKDCRQMQRAAEAEHLEL